MRDLIASFKSLGIPILIALGGLASTLLIVYFLQNDILPTWEISSYKIVNFTFTMQFMVLPVSLIALALMYFYDQISFKKYFQLGINFSIKGNDWSIYGPMMAIFFTVGNMLMMSFSVVAQHGAINSTFYSLLPLVILFSATNAWSEEIFSRFALVAGLSEKLNPVTICWISGILFGVAHFSGTPGGLSGVFLTGILGWLLAKSVIETRGIGWALIIHFIQDLVIFGAGAMIIAGQES